MRPFSNSKMARIMADCEDVEDRVLVLIQLKGGNDGVNTLVPIAQYDAYANLRPVIKIPDTGPEQYIKLDNTVPTVDQVGLHPVMTGLKSMYDKGWLNIVQAVGYENLNQSHFKSTDLWLSGGDGTCRQLQYSLRLDGSCFKCHVSRCDGHPDTRYVVSTGHSNWRPLPFPRLPY